MKSKLLKAAGVIGALTLLSRILGMIRDILSAKGFGTTWQWDAFIYAFMLPNFLRRLVGEGALTSAFIPVYTEVLAKEGEEEARRFANVIFTVLFSGLIGFLLMAQGSLFLLRGMTGPPVFHLTVKLLQVLFPYLFFIALSALATGVLNAHHHFFSPALNPVILDLVWIAGILWVGSFTGIETEEKIFFLSIFILVSGAIQLGVQIPSLLRLGFSPRFVFDFSHPALLQVGRLIVPSLFGFAVMQINLLVDMTMGFWAGAGANSSLWYGNRLMQFPLGVFAIAMGTAVLPAISRHTAREEMEEAKKTLSFALRSIFFIIFPSMVGLIVLRTPIVKLLFERGEFDTLSSVRTAFVLLCYTIGLFAYSGQKIIVTGFYSLKDTKTPMKVGVLTLLLNIGLNFLLIGSLKEGGLALATSLAGIFNFFLLMVLFHKKIGEFPWREAASSSVRILAASLLTGLVSWAVYQGIGTLIGGPETLRLLVSVFGSIGISVFVYLGLCFLFRVAEVQEAARWIRSRKE